MAAKKKNLSSKTSGRVASGSRPRRTARIDAVRRMPTQLPDGEMRGRAALLSAHESASSEGLARTARALSTVPHAWLSANRLAWWNDVPTNTGPIALEAALGGEQAFDREFASGFACVTGGATDGLHPTDVSARRVPWSGARGFLERTSEPARFAMTVESVPLLDSARPSWEVLTLRPRVSGSGGTARMLAIDFAVPQRAVGLECGYGSSGNSALDAGSFTLRAYRRDGSLITMSDGQALLAVDWRANETRRIGVRDRRGEIASVELHMQDPGLGGNDFLFVLRVWTETLPPAVVTQGALFSGTADAIRPHMPAQHPDFSGRIRGQAFFSGADATSAGAHPQTLELPLPFGCTEAAVFLRGHKWILGGAASAPIEPTKLKQIHAGVMCTIVGGADGRRARLSIDGGTIFGEQGERGVSDVVAFFTLVAWHPDRTHVVRSPIQGSAAHPRKANLLFETSNAAAVAAPGRPADLTPTMLFAAAHWMRWRFPRPVEPQRLGGAHGVFDGTLDAAPVVADGTLPAPTPLTLIRPISGGSGISLPGPHELVGIGYQRPAGINIPPLGYREDLTRIRWFSGVDVDDTLDSDERMDTTYIGSVLNGAGIDVAASLARQTLTLVDVPPRAEATDAFHPVAMRFVSPADMIVPVLGAWFVMPEDEVSTLDIEVRAELFDGETLVTRFGGGARIDSPATVDATSRPFFGLPYAAAIRATHPTPRAVLSTRNVAYDWFDGVGATQPRVFGAMRNDGNVPIQLSGFTLTGANAAEFGIEVAVGPVVRRLFDLQATQSLLLRPGEQLTIGGSFFSSAAARPGATRVARLTAQTSRPGNAPVGVDLVATGKASGAVCVVQPPRLSFGTVRTAQRFSTTQVKPALRSLVVESQGATPLMIRSIAIRFGIQARPHPDAPRVNFFSVPPSSGALAANTLYQLDPGTSLGIQLSWVPYAGGALICDLVVETNAGRFVVPVTGMAEKV